MRLTKLKNLMFENDIPAVNLAFTIGMSTSFLSQCIRGRRKVPERYKEKILAYLRKKINSDLTMEDIF